MSQEVSANSRGKRVTDLLLIGSFFALLWLPTLDTFFHVDHELLFYEKRLPAPFPKFQRGAGGLKEYIAGLDAYFGDHFGFRRRLISWHNEMESRLFHAPSVSDVILGNDGWMFFAGDKMIENYRGLTQFTPQELRDRQVLLEQRRDWLAQLGIKYVFVIAPDKQSIYPEHLASWLEPVQYHTKLDQFVDYMRAHSTVTVLDLRPALRAAKRMAPTYYHTDTHWNSFGGFVASREILKSLARPSGPEPLSADAFEFKPGQFKDGDLNALIGIAAGEKDLQLAPKTNLPPLIYVNPDPRLEFDKDSTSNSVATGTCVVFGDSFRNGLKPYLGYRFQKVGYSYMTGGFETNLIKQAKPNVVISEIVERFLDTTQLTNR